MAATASTVAEEAAAVVRWPSDGVVSKQWIDDFTNTLDSATRAWPAQPLSALLPVAVIDALVGSGSKLLHHEPNCLQLSFDPSCSVVLVGDLHGQFHDLLHLLELAGPPSPHRAFVFNGDYVDRGAWGLETFLLLLAWKMFLPDRVFLLRGNHETRFCTAAYGFEQELMSKYGAQAKHLYRKLLGCFEGLPLAAIIADSVFMAHGGLFRHMEGPQRNEKRKLRFCKPKENTEQKALSLGSLEELASTRRGILDPSGQGTSTILGDILWSDPALQDGLSPNTKRGIGLLWGPDCTEEFLQKNQLKLIVGGAVDSEVP